MLRQRAEDEFVNATAAESDADYDRIFSQIGLSQEVAAQCKPNLIVSHRKARLAGAPVLELLQARYEYDTQLKGQLEPGQYKEYREFEARRAVVRETKQISEFGKVNGVVIDFEEEQKMSAIIKSLDATTTETWHGPYAVLPRPLDGAEAITLQAQSQIADILAKLPALNAAIDEAHLSDPVKHITTGYYNNFIRQRQEEIA